MRITLYQDPVEAQDQALRELAQFSGQAATRRAFFIVPDTVTADTERSYIEKYDGLMMAEVLSFQRLAHRLLTQIGGQRKRRISREAKSLLIGRILQAQREDFPFLGRLATMAGYLDEMNRVLGDFQRYGLSATLLRDLAETRADQSGFPEVGRRKIRDFARLLEEIRKAEDAAYLYDADDDLTVLANRLENWDQYPRLNFLKTARIWISGFSLLRAFTPQEVRVIGLLDGIVEELTITLCLPDATADDRAIRAAGFAQKSLQALKQLGQPLELMTVKPETKVQPQERRVELWTASDSREELAACAGTIKTLLASGSYRNRDIAVALCREDALANAGALFQEFGLDSFVAAGRPLEESPLLRYLQIFLSLGSGRAHARDLISLAQTGLVKIDVPDPDLALDLWDNFLVASPAYRLHDLERDSLYRKFPQATHHFYTTIFQPQVKAAATLAKLPLAGEKARFLMNWLEQATGIRQQLEKLAQELNQAGDSQSALLLAGSWSAVLESLQNIEEFMGDLTLSLEEFQDLLLNPLRGRQLQGIPLGLDRIRVAGPDRLLLYPAKVLFILGATAETFPPPAPAEGLLQNRERDRIQELSGRPFPSHRKDHLAMGQSLIYYLLARGSERLYLSCPSTDPDQLSFTQAELAASRAYPQRKFTGCQHPDERWLTPERALFYTEQAAAREERLVNWQSAVEAMRAARTNRLCERVQDDPLLQVERPPVLLLPAEMSSDLKHLETISISRLETYNDCPYKHFMSYTIGAREREEYEPQPNLNGSFLHALMKEAMEALREPLLAYYAKRKLDPAQAELLRAGLPHPAFADLYRRLAAPEGDFFSYGDPRIKGKNGLYLLQTAEAVYRESLHDLLEKAYYPLWLEKFFPDRDDPHPVKLAWESGSRISLRGIMDRVDAGAEQPGVRILDYKSSQNTLPFADFLSGRNLQLPLYARTWNQNHPTQPVAGIGLWALRMPSRKLLYSPAEDTAEDKNYNAIEGEAAVDTIDRLSRYSVAYSEALLKTMRQGDISPRPLSLNSHLTDLPCSYCPYQILCGYDERLIDRRARRCDLAISSSKNRKWDDLDEYLTAFEEEGLLAPAYLDRQTAAPAKSDSDTLTPESKE